MDEIDVEPIVAVIGFAFFFLIATIGTVMASTNPDSYLYIEWEPSIDFGIIIGFLIINCFMLFILLNQSLKFRVSHNLNRRIGELLSVSDGMLYATFLNLPIQGFLVYFYIKYFDTSITIYLFILLLCELGLILLTFYIRFTLRRDQNDEY